MNNWSWREWFAFITVAAAVIVALAKCAGAECFTTSREVFKTHPGAETHATYNNIDGRKCWYARGQKPGWENTDSQVGAQLRQGTSAGTRIKIQEAGGPTRPSPASPRPATKLAGAVPTPRPRPETTGLAPRRVHTEKPPAFVWPDTLTQTDRAIETTGASTAWTVQFEPLIEERAVLIPSVVLDEDRPTKAMPTSLRSQSVSLRTVAIHLLVGVLICLVIWSGSGLVGMAWRARARAGI